MSDMRRQAGNNSWCGGESIEPLSEDEVIRFLEDHSGTEVLEEYFAESFEDT